MPSVSHALCRQVSKLALGSVQGICSDPSFAHTHQQHVLAPRYPSQHITPTMRDSLRESTCDFARANRMCNHQWPLYIMHQVYAYSTKTVLMRVHMQPTVGTPKKLSQSERIFLSSARVSASSFGLWLGEGWHCSSGNEGRGMCSTEATAGRGPPILHTHCIPHPVLDSQWCCLASPALSFSQRSDRWIFTGHKCGQECEEPNGCGLPVCGPYCQQRCKGLPACTLANPLPPSGA